MRTLWNSMNWVGKACWIGLILFAPLVAIAGIIFVLVFTQEGRK